MALGILIGVSFGDSVLVANQRDVIQLMEEKLARLREDKRRQEAELQRWEMLKTPIRRHFDGSLKGKSIVIFCAREQERASLEALLKGAGAAVAVILLPEPAQTGEGTEKQRETAEELAALLSGPEEELAAALIEGGLLSPEAGASFPQEPPDCTLLLLEGADFNAACHFAALWQALQERGRRVIALFPWRDEDPLEGTPEGEGLSLVDNIDTFWGEMALLKMIAGDISGYYGFGRGSDGLIPAQEEGEGTHGD